MNIQDIREVVKVLPELLRGHSLVITRTPILMLPDGSAPAVVKVDRVKFYVYKAKDQERNCTKEHDLGSSSNTRTKTRHLLRRRPI